MRLHRFSCTTLLLVAACDASRPSPADSAAPAAKTAPPTAAAVDFGGIGDLRIGATLASINARGNTLPAATGDERACRMVRDTTLPAGVRLMLVDDVLERIDVDSSGVQTAEGVRVGATEADVMGAYGSRVVVQPHKYTGPRGHYLIVSDPVDTTRRLVFETDGSKVTTYRAGRRPAVDLVERCG